MIATIGVNMIETKLSDVAFRFQREDGIEFLAKYISGDPACVVDGGRWRLYRLFPQRTSRTGRPVKYTQVLHKKRVATLATIDECRKFVRGQP